MIGSRKEEGRVYYTLLEKSLIPSMDRLTSTLNQKKPGSLQGFEPGLLGQNAIVLPLVPTPPSETQTNLTFVVL